MYKKLFKRRPGGVRGAWGAGRVQDLNNQCTGYFLRASGCRFVGLGCHFGAHWILKGSKIDVVKQKSTQNEKSEIPEMFYFVLLEDS